MLGFHVNLNVRYDRNLLYLSVPCHRQTCQRICEVKFVGHIFDTFVGLNQ
jgi:hypothetical protein